MTKSNALAPIKLFIVLTIISVTAHIVAINHPSGPVYDEVHVGKFINAYCCTHEAIFDLHPPHPKLLIAGFMKMTGYKGETSFEEIGEEFVGLSGWQLRLIPTILGSVFPLAFALSLYLLGVSALMSFLWGLLLLMENGILIQSRLALPDAFLMTFVSLSLLTALYAKQKSQLRWWIICGVFCGFSVGSKLTGIIAPLLALALCLRQQNISISRQFILALNLTLATFLVYLGGWLVHFRLITEPGVGDYFFTPQGSFWKDLWDMHLAMWRENSQLSGTHEDASRWWLWPIMTKPIYYWTDEKSDIYFINNPVVWLGIHTALIPLAIKISLEKWNQKDRMTLLFIGAYLFSYLPYWFFSRVTFIYHYLIPFYFLILIVSYGLRERIDKSPTLFKISVLLAVLIGFAAMSPLTFGFGTAPHWIFNLLPSWR